MCFIIYQPAGLDSDAVGIASYDVKSVASSSLAAYAVFLDCKAVISLVMFDSL